MPQYIGTIRKIDNRQRGVFLAYAGSRRRARDSPRLRGAWTIKY
ncbi:MAG: hypothetical protein ACRDRW_11020 [Pseudonocardiaceae bacterium]